MRCNSFGVAKRGSARHKVAVASPSTLPSDRRGKQFLLQTRSALVGILQELASVVAAGDAAGDGVAEGQAAPDRRSPPHWCLTGDSLVGDVRLRGGPTGLIAQGPSLRQKRERACLQMRTALERILQELTRLAGAGPATGDEVEKKHAATDRRSPPRCCLTGDSLVGDVRLRWDPRVSSSISLA